MIADHLTEVDELTLGEHWYLDERDQCYFLGEYTPRKGFAYSETNQLILNLKKPMNHRGRSDWPYKAKAIQQSANLFRNCVNHDWLEQEVTIVPVPPSKCKSDPMYDNRMREVADQIGYGIDLDVRELVIQNTSTVAAHDSNDRPSPEKLIELYSIDESITDPAPKTIAVLDDLLTAGSHFKAMKRILSERFPETEIIGFFIARRRVEPQEIDFDAIFEDL